MYMKKQEATVTTVTTTMVQEPRVGDIPPVVVSDYEREQMVMQRKTQTMTFVSGQVKYTLLRDVKL